LIQAALTEAGNDTGIDSPSLGDPSSFRPGLEVVCRALENLPDLPTAGRFAARQQILRALKQRARRIAWRTQRPELFADQLRPPVIVLGLPRTGTTFLHRLLCAPSDARALPMWEVAMPFPPLSGDDNRQQVGQRAARAMKRAIVDIDLKHATGSDEPEECMHLQDDAFFSWSWFSNFPIPTYTRWLQTADATHAYQVWSEVLRYVQQQDPSKRLTLKSPSHTAHIATLLDAVPDARIVWTHRDPSTVVPSFASLISTTRGIATTPVTADPHALGRETSEFLADQLKRGLAARPRIPTGQLIDISFEDLRRAPLDTVARIHNHFGLPWTPDVSRSVQAQIDARPAKRHGAHQYALSDFGLSTSLMAKLFDGYHVPEPVSG